MLHPQAEDEEGGVMIPGLRRRVWEHVTGASTPALVASAEWRRPQM